MTRLHFAVNTLLAAANCAAPGSGGGCICVGEGISPPPPAPMSPSPYYLQVQAISRAISRDILQSPVQSPESPVISQGFTLPRIRPPHYLQADNDCTSIGMSVIADKDECLSASNQLGLINHQGDLYPSVSVHSGGHLPPPPLTFADLR